MRPEPIQNALDPDLMINVPLLLEVKEAIQKWPEHFNMVDFQDSLQTGHSLKFNPATDERPVCDTAVCLGGWGWVLGRRQPLPRQRGQSVTMWSAAQRLYGLTHLQANCFFVGRGLYGNSAISVATRDSLAGVTVAEACAAIDSLIESAGARIDWTVKGNNE